MEKITIGKFENVTVELGSGRLSLAKVETEREEESDEDGSEFEGEDD